MTTANELRKAIRLAGLPAREQYVFRVLLDRAEDKTAIIPDIFQPRSLDDRYFWGLSRHTVQRALPHLCEHGWVTWVPWTARPMDETSKPRTAGRRGHPKSHYAVHPGEPCTCRPRRRIQRQDDAESGSDIAPGLPPDRAPGLPGIERHTFRECAGQTPDSADRAAVGGEGRARAGAKPGDCAVCGAAMDAKLTARTGYRTHPCCDPHEVPDRSTDLIPDGAA